MVHTVGRRSTQIDPDNDPPVRSGRFAGLSSDSVGDSPCVQVCRAPSAGCSAVESICTVSSGEAAIDVLRRISQDSWGV